MSLRIDDGWTVIKSRRTRQQDLKNDIRASTSGSLIMPSTQSLQQKYTLCKAKSASTAPNDEPPVPAYFQKACYYYERGLSAEKQLRIFSATPVQPRVPKARLKPQLPIHCLVPSFPDKVKQKPHGRCLDRSVKCYPRLSSSTTRKKPRKRSSQPKPGIINNFLQSQIKWSNYKRTGTFGCTAGACSQRPAGGAGGSS